MLHLIFDNTPSIDGRARRAVGRIVERLEEYPDWPNYDLVYERASCYTCGEFFWAPEIRRGGGGECPQCVTIRDTDREIERELRRLEMEEKRAQLAELMSQSVS